MSDSQSSTPTIIRRSDALATRIAVAGVALVLLLAFSSGLEWPGRHAAGPLSSLAFLGTIAASIALPWRIRRRVRTVVEQTKARACEYCLYDLRGVPIAGKCPECGEIYDIKRTISNWRAAYPELLRPKDDPEA